MGPIGCHETSVLNQPTLHNNLEDGRIQTVIVFIIIIVVYEQRGWIA
jgi:hypothetical protein